MKDVEIQQAINKAEDDIKQLKQQQLRRRILKLVEERGYAIVEDDYQDYSSDKLTQKLISLPVTLTLNRCTDYPCNDADYAEVDDYDYKRLPVWTQVINYPSLPLRILISMMIG